MPILSPQAQPTAEPLVRSPTSRACRGRWVPSCRTWPRCPHLLLSALQELLQDPRALQKLEDAVRGP